MSAQRLLGDQWWADTHRGPCIRAWVCFLGVIPAVHTSTQLDGVTSTANPSHLLKVGQDQSGAALGVHPLGNRFPRVVWGSWGHKPPAKAPVHVLRCSVVLVLGQVSAQRYEKDPSCLCTPSCFCFLVLWVSWSMRK